MGGVFNPKVFNRKVFNVTVGFGIGGPPLPRREFHKYAISTVNIESPVKVKALSASELHLPQLIKHKLANYHRMLLEVPS